MAQPQTTTERKIQLWSDRVRSWRQSGLSQRVYCEQHQLVLGTFVYWRCRLKKLETGEPADKPRFLPITIKQQSDTSLTLLIDDRHRLEIRPDFDPDFLSKVVLALQKIAWSALVHTPGYFLLSALLICANRLMGYPFWSWMNWRRIHSPVICLYFAIDCNYRLLALREYFNYKVCD